MKTEEKKTLAIYPAYHGEKIGKFGFGVGWYRKKENYCFEWGNFKTREEANKVLIKEYPDAEIVNLDKYPRTINHSEET